MSATDAVIYVYGIVPGQLDVRSAPRGLDESRVTLVTEGELGALVSELDAAAYAAARVEALVADVGWLSPRAVAHDAVLSWASARGAVIPLKMLTLFSTRDAVRDMLRSRSGEMRETLARVAPGEEYAVRVFRLAGALSEHLAELSARVRELETAAAAANPGQRYLLERKLESERATEIRRVVSEVVRDVQGALADAALDSAREPPPRPLVGESGEESEGTAVLNGFFLVPRGGADTFHDTLRRLARRHEQHGFRFEVTGPWPPYHFARGRE
ncbi:MAG TPA: GvpL/GvpF family gas vesicle protein [Gemmatimonadaceae bacterium]|nr:GvpL/GvpF family gas vesicle protein [Gemmatimonadaceae bacterium]